MHNIDMLIGELELLETKLAVKKPSFGDQDFIRQSHLLNLRVPLTDVRELLSKIGDEKSEVARELDLQRQENTDLGNLVASARIRRLENIKKSIKNGVRENYNATIHAITDEVYKVLESYLSPEELSTVRDDVDYIFFKYQKL